MPTTSARSLARPSKSLASTSPSKDTKPVISSEKVTQSDLENDSSESDEQSINEAINVATNLKSGETTRSKFNGAKSSISTPERNNSETECESDSDSDSESENES